MKTKKTKIEKLAEKLDFRTEVQYFNDCIDSYLNGSFKEATELFNNMNKEGQKALLKYIGENDENFTEPMLPTYQFFFNLLFAIDENKPSFKKAKTKALKQIKKFGY